METIKSFTVDHKRLLPGVYVSRKDSTGHDVVTTFDIRMTRPNFEPVMNTAEIHTLEHLGATFLRNHEEWGDKIMELMDTVDDYFPDPERDTDKPFLMPVEDVFTITGRGTVATGRVERGTLHLTMKLKSSVLRKKHRRQLSQVLKCSESFLMKLRLVITSVLF